MLTKEQRRQTMSEDRLEFQMQAEIDEQIRTLQTAKRKIEKRFHPERWKRQPPNNIPSIHPASPSYLGSKEIHHKC